MTTIYRENIDHTVEDDLNGRNNNWDILEDVNNKKHTHNNKSILDAITQVLINNWNTAVTHISDSVKHITSTERANWDAKETPAGAQAKVDAHANQVDNPHEVTKSQVGLDNVDNVQQATKAEFDSHDGDSTKHITASERTTWNGKLDSSHADLSASTTAKGHVQLNNTVTSTSTTQAATANAVKTAYDKGNHSHPYASSTHTHTKSQVGLGNVDNVQQATKEEFDLHVSDIATHVKPARIIIGTSASGWTAKDCHYLCDGTADDVEIIQALNDLPATGGEVVILDGTYNITASINIPKDNVSIRGSGNATTLKRMYNSTNTDSGPTARGLITLNEKSGCKIQGLQIDGNKATYTASYNYGIYLSSSSDNTVTGNTCNNNNYGIYLYSSSSDNTVTGNTCNNNSYGIYLSSSSNNTVTGNTCNNNNNGIYLSSSSNNTVTGNTCNNNYYGIRLSSSSDNTVTGNTCNNNNYGIYLFSSSSDNTVTGNTCNNNNSYGIYLSSSSSDNTVTGNTCNNNSNGIYLFSSSDNTVTGNTCIRGTGQTSDYASDQYTIRLQGTANNYNLISSNNCMGKAVVVEGGTGNSAWGNKFDNTDDLP